MAKKTTPATSDEDVITVEAVEIIPKKNEAQALALVDPFNTMLEQLKEQYGSVEITDKTSLAFAQAGISTMTKLRNQVEKRRLEIFRPVMELQKNVKAKVDQFVLDVKAIEQPIRDKINAEELRLQEEARAEHIRRVNSLQESGWTLVGQFYTCGVHRILFDQIDTATPEQLTEWVEVGQKELKRIADERAAQAQREKELAEREAKLKQQEAEMEEFRRWKAAQAAEMAAALVETPPQECSETPEVEAPAPIAQAPAATHTFNTAPVQLPTQAMNAWGNPQAPAANIGQVVSQTTPSGEYSAAIPESLKELAKFYNKNVSWLMQTPEFKVYWNMAIDNVLLRFTNESHTKADWVEIFNRLKK